MLDCSGGCLLKLVCRRRGDPASGNHWLTMPHGAHHLDLREPRPEDPPDVTAARAEEQRILKGWIDEATGTAASRL